MVLDKRLANTPRWKWSSPDMRVPDELLECSLFLGDYVRGQDGTEKPHLRGTAFVVSVPAEGTKDVFYQYIVTAKHSVDRLLGKPKWFLRWNLASGGDEGFADIVVNPGDLVKWWFHPTEENSVDAAVTLVPSVNFEGSTAKLDIRLVPVSTFVTDESIQRFHIGCGDMVFFIGLFTKMTGRQKNIPIVRMGNIAMMPPEMVPGIGPQGVESEVYLIEARSVSGISGAPVFVRETVYMPSVAVGDDQRRMDVFMPGQFHFLGLMHGHWDVREQDINEAEITAVPRSDRLGVNVGIAVVVPAKKILEILMRPELVEERRQADARRKEAEGATTPD